MQDSDKVLVVGTTADYVEWIRQNNPGRALFLTDTNVRKNAHEPIPDPAEEIRSDLSDRDRSLKALKAHLEKWHLGINAITSFDCESMELAAAIAADFALLYPPVKAVIHCRDKFISKERWYQNELLCPRAAHVSSADDAVKFFREIGRPCVLKPLSGSGSELIFLCDSETACRENFQNIQKGLLKRGSNRLFQPLYRDKPVILAEEYITGVEYSCDFIVADGGIRLIRLTRKLISSGGPFGTIQGYVLLNALPAPIKQQKFQQILYRSATALGLFRSICMLDFLVRGDEIVLLELSPRPGGDCLPFLLRQDCHVDMLKLTLDFAQRRPIQLPEFTNGKRCVGLRIHARESGILKRIDPRMLRHDPRVCEVHLSRRPGHAIRMPPEDYDSWLLGHIIFRPDENPQIENQCQELIRQLAVKIE